MGCVEQVREKKNSNSFLLEEIRHFSQALGYCFKNVVELIGGGWKDDFETLKATVGSPQSVVRVGEGVEQQVFIDEESNHLITLIRLEPGRCIRKSQMVLGDLVFGMIDEGSLMLDTLTQEKVFKEKDCFYFKGNSPFEMWNMSSFHNLSVLLYSTLPESRR